MGAQVFFVAGCMLQEEYEREQKQEADTPDTLWLSGLVGFHIVGTRLCVSDLPRCGRRFAVPGGEDHRFRQPPEQRTANQPEPGRNRRQRAGQPGFRRFRHNAGAHLPAHAYHLYHAGTHPAAVSRTPSPEEAANYREGKLSTGGVNLRAGPSTNDNIIGTDFAKGTKLKVYAVEGDFYFVQVVAIGKYGFISQKFVETSGITPEPIPTQIPEGAVGGRVSASTVMLRNGPGTDYTALGQFSKGTQVYVFFQTNDWAYVEIAASGEYGYMKADFIAMQSTPPSGTPVP